MAGIPDCTLTTACYLLTKYHPYIRTKEDTIKSVETLLKVPCYLVIYCNEPMEQHLRDKRNEYGLSHLTKIIVQEVEDLWYPSLLDTIKSNRQRYWPTMDQRSCPESHLIMCNKAEFVLQTIHSNPFQTSKFGWIDGNIGENGSKISKHYANNMLLRVLHNVTDKFHLQILNVTDKKYKLAENKREYYEQYRWLMCGCLYTTTKDIGIKILTRLKEITVETTQQGYGHAEEMFFLEILDEFYDDIQRSYGDYNDLLHNFIKPTTNFIYIYWQCVMKYFDAGYYRDCIDVCKTLLKQFDNFEVEINYDLYVRLYSFYYLSLVKTDSSSSENVAQEIRTHYKMNPQFANQFNNLRYICRMDHFVL